MSERLQTYNGREVAGLIPAGGYARRISPLPCSKEIYPVGFRRAENGEQRPKVSAHYLLDRMRQGGITRTYVILRNGKWDIPAYLGDGALANMHLAYLMKERSFGVPDTLDQAYPFVDGKLVALGLSDVLFAPKDAFAQLLDRQASSEADVVLGVFPAQQPSKEDMVALRSGRWVERIMVKPAETELEFTWMLAVWTPRFMQFMHEHLSLFRKTSSNGDSGELYLGDVFNAAIEQGQKIDAVVFREGTYLDIGTPENLVERVGQLE